MRQIDVMNENYKIEKQSAVNLVMNIDAAISDLNSETGIELLNLHKKIITHTDHFLTEIGGYFFQAQELLSKPGYGSFTMFYEACGYEKTTVMRLMNRFKLLVANGTQRQMLETLPTRVLSEAGKTNADPEFKEKVLSGEITSIKEMEQWKEEKRKLEAEKMSIMNQRDHYAQEKVKLEQQLAKKNADILMEGNSLRMKDIDIARSDERQKAEAEYSAKLKEERKRIEEQFNNDIRRHENTVAQLENELTILRPLKKRESEIIALQKQLDENREEVQRAKVRNTLFTAVASARTNFNNTIYPVVTITITPDAIGDTLETELKDLLKMTENFAFALKEKFNLR
jgi:hypothetical protein